MSILSMYECLIPNCPFSVVFNDSHLDVDFLNVLIYIIFTIFFVFLEQSRGVTYIATFGLRTATGTQNNIKLVRFNLHE